LASRLRFSADRLFQSEIEAVSKLSIFAPHGEALAMVETAKPRRVHGFITPVHEADARRWGRL
jgi:hypothetical protein